MAKVPSDTSLAKYVCTAGPRSKSSRWRSLFLFFFLFLLEHATRSPVNFEAECRTTSILSRFAIVAKGKGEWGKSEQKEREGNRGERNVKDRSFWNENRPVEPTPLPPFYSFSFLVSHKRTCFKLELSRNEFAYVTIMEQLSRDRPFDPLSQIAFRLFALPLRVRSFYSLVLFYFRDLSETVWC